MKNIIIYGSKYGSTKKYAEELSRKTDIKAVSFEDVREINDYDNIIYLGGVYAGVVSGMAKTLRKLHDAANKTIILVTVGLADPTDEKNIENLRNNIKTQISKEIYDKAKIFHLRGGIDYSKLSFAHKTMMKLLYNAIKKTPQEKLTAEKRAIIETYNKKEDFTDYSMLDKIIKEIKN